MKLRNMAVRSSALVGILTVLFTMNVHAEDDSMTSREYLNSLNAGITDVVDASSYNSDQSKAAVESLAAMVPEKEEEEQEELSDLFMANVNNSVNVRTMPDENSDKAGLLYKDCGGRILERGDDWTRIQSGDLVGWVSNDYILFDDEAAALAEDVGFKIITVETDALRIRKEPSTDAGIVALVASGDELDVMDDTDPDWIEVDYEGETGYVSAEFVNITFSIDAGETIEAIEIREAEEAEAKRQAKLHEQQAKVFADGDEIRLLAALIQCETGYQSYEGMLAVGAVVMNRVRSGAYPNTITSVIYASGQFTPALNGKVAAVYNGKVNDACIQAAKDAIDGKTNVGDATHFRRAGNHDGILIAGQVFW